MSASDECCDSHPSLSHVPELTLQGMPIAAITAEQLLSEMLAALSSGSGGWIVTVNLDILLRFQRDPVARRAYLAADVRVADGMPLVWAAKIQGDALPERVAGSTLCEQLLQPCGTQGYPLLLVGGAPGSAERAVERCTERVPVLHAVGNSGLRFSQPPSPKELETAVAWIEAQIGSRDRRCVVLVGLGSPKQELVIQELRRYLPRAWFMGVGGSFSFLAGDVSRAPLLLQRLGFEWLHRLAQEPGRLARRYLIDDAPFALALLLRAAVQRVARAGKSKS